MGNRKHASEPWSKTRGVICFCDFDDLGDGSSAIIIESESAYQHIACVFGDEEESADRIIACVNACTGLNPEAVPELLAACQEFVRFSELPEIVRRDDYIRYQLAALAAAREAIAKAKGQP